MFRTRVGHFYVLAHARARLLRRRLDGPLLAVDHRRHGRRALEAGGLHLFLAVDALGVCAVLVASDVVLLLRAVAALALQRRLQARGLFLAAHASNAGAFC